MMRDIKFGEMIFQKLLLTEFIKQYLTAIIISIIANIIQMLFISWITSFIHIHYIIDFILQIGISFTITINNIKIYQLVEKFAPDIDIYVTRFIQGYNIKKYKFLKRVLVTGSFILCGLYIYQYPIDNQRVYGLLIHSISTFGLLELWDDYYLQEWLKKFCKKNPTINIISSEEYTKFMIDSYIGEKNVEPPKNIISGRKININQTDLSMGFIDK